MSQTWPCTLVTTLGSIPDPVNLGLPVLGPHPQLQFIIGSRDVSALVGSDWRFSNVDPGGLESLTLRLTSPIDVEPGTRVKVWYGCECVFWGDINDPGDHSQGTYSTAMIVAVGPGYYAKQNGYREIYVDRDLSRWGGIPAPRLLELLEAGYSLIGTWGNTGGGDDGTRASSSTGPMIAWTEGNSIKTSGATTVVNEVFYDSEAIPIGALYYDYQSYDKGAGGLGLLGGIWEVTARLSSVQSNIAGLYDISADLADGTGTKTGYLAATAGTRVFAFLDVREALAEATDVAGSWSAMFRNLAVYGTHGLARRGSDPGGFYPSDIVLDAMKRVVGIAIVPGRIDTAASYIIRHLAYLGPTLPEQVWLDMAKIMGWHVGVWEPAGFTEQPRLFFHPVPQSATGTAAWTDCTEAEAPRVRLDNIFSECRVAYSDASGQTRYATVARPSPFRVSVNRRLEVNMGMGTASDAQTYGKFALALAEAAARGGGGCTLPPVVDTPQGPKPSVLLKAGRDRIRLRGLTQISSLLDTDTRREDTFHLRRVENTGRADGSIATHVEFDSGGDLLETLTARSAEALLVAGV